MIIMVSLILSFLASCGSGFSTPAPVDRTDIKYVFVEDNPSDFEDYIYSWYLYEVSAKSKSETLGDGFTYSNERLKTGETIYLADIYEMTVKSCIDTFLIQIEERTDTFLITAYSSKLDLDHSIYAGTFIPEARKDQMEKPRKIVFEVPKEKLIIGYFN